MRGSGSLGIVQIKRMSMMEVDWRSPGVLVVVLKKRGGVGHHK